MNPLNFFVLKVSDFIDEFDKHFNCENIHNSSKMKPPKKAKY